MTENKNIKSLNQKFKKRAKLSDVAKYAGISHAHLTNITAGRRKASESLKRRIENAYRKAFKENTR